MNGRDPIGAAFVYGLGAAVSVVWMVSVFAEVLSAGNYSTPLAVHGLMGTVVGSVFADAGLRRARNKISRENEEEGNDGRT